MCPAASSHAAHPSCPLALPFREEGPVARTQPVPFRSQRSLGEYFLGLQSLEVKKKEKETKYPLAINLRMTGLVIKLSRYVILHREILPSFGHHGVRAEGALPLAGDGSLLVAAPLSLPGSRLLR